MDAFGKGEYVIAILIRVLAVEWKRQLYRSFDTDWTHDDVIKWKHFPRYWPFVRGINRFPVNSQHKVQWYGALIYFLFCTRINSWVNKGEAGDLRRHRAHYDVIVMISIVITGV